ncbi:kinase domain protein [Ceratobasidium sp. AG-Ba]|nr:kinase domain protein [Ceratobasidium sp. AG-Ba]
MDPDQTKLKEAVNQGPSPSTAAKPSNFLEEQLRGAAPIYNGRPRSKQGLPLEIYHPVFHAFTQRIQSNDIPDSDSLRAMEFFMSISQAVYACEAQRTLAVKNHLKSLLGVEAITVEPANSCTADGVIMTKSHVAIDDPSAYLLVMEVKNEVGTGDSDPSIQGAKSYARYWSDDNLDYVRKASCCPSFILAIAGPWVCMLGAVWTENIVVHPFTEYIWMGRQVHDDDRLCQLTRMFIALREGIYSLRRYYDTLPKQCQEIPGRFFPYIKEFSLDGENVQFDYLETLALSPARPVFRAVVRSNPDRLIVVKFVRNYNSDAHKILGAHSLAPRLIYDSAKTLDCGFRMIVMEHIDGPDLFAYLKSHPTEDCINQIRADVRCALTLLHQKHLVFGDLRKPNILVVRKQQGLGAMLIDFDWCSTHREGRYPLSLNDTAKMWTQGIARGGLMDKKHDNDMLGILFSPEDPF